MQHKYSKDLKKCHDMKLTFENDTSGQVAACFQHIYETSHKELLAQDCPKGRWSCWKDLVCPKLRRRYDRFVANCTTAPVRARAASELCPRELRLPRFVGCRAQGVLQARSSDRC